MSVYVGQLTAPAILAPDGTPTRAASPVGMLPVVINGRPLLLSPSPSW
jgi:hypothetical protein